MNRAFRKLIKIAHVKQKVHRKLSISILFSNNVHISSFKQHQTMLISKAQASIFIPSHEMTWLCPYFQGPYNE